MWPFTSIIDYRITAASKRSAQDARIRATFTHLGSAKAEVPVLQDLEYLKVGAREIVEKIKRGEWTATRVLEAYVRSAMRAHENTNCLTEIMFMNAFERARQLDKEFSVTGGITGPLHGVPVSVKDQFFVQGEDATIGFTHLADQVLSNDAPMVQLLLDAGAVLIAKTNVPQTMLAFECGNPLFGATSNPYKKGFTCGGSSGGEAALLASDGAALGIGSDIGGSLRIPGHYSGCYGLKPCWGRFIGWGTRTAAPGFEAVKTSTGPMGRCVDDLELASKTLLQAGEKFWRRYNLIPLPWRDVDVPKKLKLGYFLNDQVAKASPACQRAVQETVNAMRREGHEVIEVDVRMIGVLQALELFVSLTSADGYATLLSGLKGDPREDSLFLVTLGPSLPWPIRSLASFLLKHLVGDEIMATVVAASRAKSVQELMVWQSKREVFSEHVRRYLWDELALDAVICPSQSMPALPIGSTWNRSMIAVATFFWNVCDSTVGQLPVTFVDPSLDSPTQAWSAQPFLSPSIDKALYGPNTGLYDPEKMAGLPVGVQIVGAQWEEEKVLGIMRVVEAVLERSGKRRFGPGKFTERDI